MNSRERRKKQNGKVGLGDVIEKALDLVGVTSESVAEWLGSCGGCKRRKRLANDLGDWAKRLIGGRIKEDEALEELEERIKGNVQ